MSAYEQMIAQLVAELGTTLWRHPRQVYLAYLPSTETEHGQIGILEDEAPLPDGWELVTSESVPLNRTLVQLGQWLRARTGRIPILRRS